MRIYDVECIKCGHVEEQWVEDNKFQPCSKCGGSVKRLFSTFNFKLVYDNKKDMCSWGYSGYSSSRYWEDIKKEKAKGKDVHPVK